MERDVGNATTPTSTTRSGARWIESLSLRSVSGRPCVLIGQLFGRRHSLVCDSVEKKEQNNEIQPSPPASERGFTEFLHRVLRIVSRWIGCIRFALVDLLLKWEKNERINSCRCSFLSFIELRIGHCGVFLYQKIFMPPHFHAMNWFCIVGFSEFYRNRMDVLFFSLPCDDVFEIRFQYLFIPIVSIDPLVVWSLDHTKDNKPSMKKNNWTSFPLCLLWYLSVFQLFTGLNRVVLYKAIIFTFKGFPSTNRQNEAEHKGRLFSRMVGAVQTFDSSYFVVFFVPPFPLTGWCWP